MTQSYERPEHPENGLFDDQPNVSDAWLQLAGPCTCARVRAPESVPHSIWLLDRVNGILADLDPLGLIECSGDPDEYRAEAEWHMFLLTAGAISSGTVATVWAWWFWYDYLPRPETISEIVERLERLRTEWLALPGIPPLARTGTDDRP